MFLKRKATPAPSGSPEFMVVGLGNPGKDYEFTRHNAGFLFMDMLADKLNVKINKIKAGNINANAISSFFIANFLFDWKTFTSQDTFVHFNITFNNDAVSNNLFSG